MYMKKYDLAGRTAFVTGGGRGIGFCAAQAPLEAGARVVISDIDEGLLQSAKDKLAGKGDVETLALDITDSSAVAAAARQANMQFGAVDILIANAGITWPDTDGEDMSDEVWRKVIDVDLNGAYWSCREFGRAMLERGSGAIVTVGSMPGLISNKPQRQFHARARRPGPLRRRRQGHLRDLDLLSGAARPSRQLRTGFRRRRRLFHRQAR